MPRVGRNNSLSSLLQCLLRTLVVIVMILNLKETPSRVNGGMRVCRGSTRFIRINPPPSLNAHRRTRDGGRERERDGGKRQVGPAVLLEAGHRPARRVENVCLDSRRPAHASPFSRRSPSPATHGADHRLPWGPRVAGAAASPVPRQVGSSLVRS